VRFAVSLHSCVVVENFFLHGSSVFVGYFALFPDWRFATLSELMVHIVENHPTIVAEARRVLTQFRITLDEHSARDGRAQVAVPEPIIPFPAINAD
jgi:hypothetical protein